MNATMARRSFIKVAGTTAAGALAVGAASTALADEAQSWMPQSWDCEADAVVLGLGAAGATAAVDMADKGLSVIVLEKTNYELAGGDCAVCGGYVIPVTDPVEVLCSSLNDIDADYAAVYAEYNAQIPEYLEGIGVELDTESFPGMAISVRQDGETYGGALFRAFRTAVENRSDLIEVKYETPAIGLVQDPVSGEVLGVKAGSADSPIYVRAKRGVVVATGSYEGDQVMMNALHMPGVIFPTIGSPYNTGDGLKMLMKAGCKVQNIAKSLEYAAFAVKPASEEVGTGLVIPTSFDTDGYIFVNVEGRRFMNETANIQHSKEDSIFQINTFSGGLHSTSADTRYVNMPAFMVFDEATKNSRAIAGTNGNGNGWNTHIGYEWSADNSAEVEKGWIVVADTLEELAEKVSARDLMGNEVHIDGAALVEQVKQYNDMVDAGEADEFGREPVGKIGDGPYYATEIIPATLYAGGGASHDVNAQAIDWADQPIPRLYMAGLVGDPFTLHSPALQAAVTWGRIASENIVALEPWA